MATKPSATPLNPLELPALAAVGLHKSFDQLVVIEELTLTLERGCRVGVIGPNGAGKTTLLNLLTGELKPGRGQVLLNGVDVSRLSVDQRARRGLARSFQSNCLLQLLTVRENLTIACILKRRQQNANRWGLWRSLANDRKLHREVDELAEQLCLTAILEHTMATLPYGSQRQLEISLALCMESSTVLLLDEPTAGMSAEETQDLIALIQALPKELAVLIIEHDMETLCSIVERIIVLDHGSVTMDADPVSVRSSEALQQRYLGGC